MNLLAELARIESSLTPGPLTVEVDASRKHAWLYDAKGRLINGRFGMPPDVAADLAALRNLLPALIAKLRDAGEREARLEAALRQIDVLCGTVNMSNERQKREAIEGSLEIAESALAPPADREGEGR